MLSFSFTHLIPEAVELAPGAFLVVLFSFLVFYALEQTLSLHVCHEGEECQVRQTLTLVSWAGLLIHSLIDGIIIGVGFEVSLALGILSTLAVLLHELPEGVSSMAVMLYGGYPPKKAVLYSSLVALATPLGAVLSCLLLGGVNENLVGWLLAIGAGSFLYVAAADLIPEIHKKSKALNIVLTLLGVLVPLAVGSFLH